MATQKQTNGNQTRTMRAMIDKIDAMICAQEGVNNYWMAGQCLSLKCAAEDYLHELIEDSNAD